MKRSPIAFGFALLLLAGSGPAMGRAAEDYRPSGANIPATAAPIGNAERDFQFAIVGDRTGGHRIGVFEDAIDKIDALRPDFILSIGDLIEGNSENRQRLDQEWSEIDTAISKLKTRFFFVPGNHDLTNDVQRDIWRKRYGADYYSFLYKDVLFLILNTEDPPQPKIARAKLLEQYGAEAMRTVFTALQGDPATAEALFARDPRLAELAVKVRGAENVAISDAQIAMARKALAAAPTARWTFVLMHRPAWKIGSPAYQQIETMLKGRPHTVLAGHYHRYQYERRGDIDHIQLGTTGGLPGGSPADPAVVDHIMWVSMASPEPLVTNIRLDGFFAKEGPHSLPKKDVSE